MSATVLSNVQENFVFLVLQTDKDWSEGSPWNGAHERPKVLVLYIDVVKKSAAST